MRGRPAEETYVPNPDGGMWGRAGRVLRFDDQVLVREAFPVAGHGGLAIDRGGDDWTTDVGGDLLRSYASGRPLAYYGLAGDGDRNEAPALAIDPNGDLWIPPYRTGELVKVHVPAR